MSTASRGRFGRNASRVEVFYLAQPRGGRLQIVIDGREVSRVSTASAEAKPGYASFELADGPHRLELRPVGDGEVRLFGVAFDRAEPGVILDTLGIPGARARSQLQWEPETYKEHLRKRAPDLVLLAYGTNESGDAQVSVTEYELGLRRVVERLREAVPAASCVLVGPTDWPVKTKGGGYAPRAKTTEITEAQRRVAADFGCGFFDVLAFMGGPGAMVNWVQHEPPMAVSDHVHLTYQGYERLGSVLTAALVGPR